MISFPSKVEAVKNIIRTKWTYSSKYTPIFIATYHISIQQLSLFSLTTTILQDYFSFNLSLKSCSNAYPYSKSSPYRLPAIWTLLSGFLWSLKELNYQCSRHKRHGLYPWIGKIPWKSVWQPTLALNAKAWLRWWKERLEYSPWVLTSENLKVVSLGIRCLTEFMKICKRLRWLHPIVWK